MRTLATFQSKPLRWLWPHHFPLGKLSLMVGEQGAGKSFMAADLAARVSAGLPWPLQPDQPNPAAGVLLLTEEHDLADVTLPRLEAAGADLARIMVLTDVTSSDNNPAHADAATETAEPFSLANDLTQLEQAIANTPGCHLVIIDPLSAFLPQATGRKKPDLPTIFKQLAALAARTGVAIVAVTSFLASASAATNHRTVATLAAHPGPTCVWRVTPDPQDKAQRHLQPIKNNLAPPNAPLDFTLQSTPAAPTAKITWQPTSSDPASTPPTIPQLPTPNSELLPHSELQSPQPPTTSHQSPAIKADRAGDIVAVAT